MNAPVHIRHMLTPIRVGNVELKNRVVRTAHGTDIGKFHVDENLIAYHAARAKGGVALSCLETLSVHPESSPGHLDPFDPTLIGGYRDLMRAVRPYGMRMIQQVWHGGHNAHRKDGLPPWSASDRPGLFDGIPSQPMTKGMIDFLVERFAESVAVVREGELDGVEIHCAHGYLLQQFMSPLHNRREDEYGGTFENRLRFPLEVLRAVRARVGTDIIVGVRLSPEGVEGGMTVEDVAGALQAFQAEGLIDYANISLGNYYTLHKIIGAMHEPVGYELPTTDPIGAVAKVPRIASGRFRTLEEADQVISRGEADLVGMTRAHIADPDIVRKTMAGHPEQVRPCIACNQGCVGGQKELGHLGCTVNPAVGKELTLAEDLIVKADRPRKVMVVGGGPAGLEAARVAALRGHHTILCEASADLGGGVNVAKRAPRRQVIGDIVDWMTQEVYRLGVEVRLSTYVEASDIREENPDAVVIATGSLPVVTGFQLHAPHEIPEGIDLPHVVTSTELLTGQARYPEACDAVVFDSVGHYEAIAAAEHLIENGHRVTFVTGYPSFIPKLEISFVVQPALERLARTGRFRIMTRTAIQAIGPESVTCYSLFASQQVDEIPAGLVVMVSPQPANGALRDELDDFPGTIAVVGDALSPRFLRIAIAEGHNAARTL